VSAVPPIDLRITFRRTGGFAGVPLEVAGRVDELDLPDEVRARLRRLASDGVDGGAPPGTSTPDGFAYVLRVESAGGDRELRWSDATLPGDLAPVVSSLVRLARPPSRGG
jgi:hypothetical protein